MNNSKNFAHKCILTLLILFSANAYASPSAINNAVVRAKCWTGVSACEPITTKTYDEMSNTLWVTWSKETWSYTKNYCSAWENRNKVIGGKTNLSCEFVSGLVKECRDIGKNPNRNELSAGDFCASAGLIDKTKWDKFKGSAEPWAVGFKDAADTADNVMNGNGVPDTKSSFKAAVAVGAAMAIAKYATQNHLGQGCAKIADSVMNDVMNGAKAVDLIEHGSIAIANSMSLLFIMDDSSCKYAVTLKRLDSPLFPLSNSDRETLTRCSMNLPEVLSRQEKFFQATINYTISEYAICTNVKH